MFQPDEIKIEDFKEKAVYDHGFSEEKVLEIKAAHEELFKRVAGGHRMSLKEFKETMIPYIRIHRTEAFALNSTIKKVKEKAEKIPKPLKEKKLTKKAINLKINEIIMLMATGKTLSEEDQLFWNTHACNGRKNASV